MKKQNQADCPIIMISYLVEIMLLMGAQALTTPKEQPVSGHPSAPLRAGLIESDVSINAVAQELVDRQCEDSAEMKRLGPVVQSISEFFQKDAKETKGVIVYPWALTMLGATRWGGISLFEQNTTQSIDHDLDFLIQMPGKTHEDAKVLIKAWQDHLLKTTGLESVDISEGPLSAQQHRKLSEAGTQSDRFAIVVKQKSGVGRTLVKDTTFRKDFFDRVYRQKVKEVVPDLANPPTVARAAADKVTHDILFKQFETIFEKSEIVQHEYTMIDFWVKTDHLGRDYQPSHKTKTLLMGSTFPFPENPEVIHKDIQASYLPGHQMWNTKSLCDLRVPNNLFNEDVKSSPQMSKLVDTCTKALSKKGYASLLYCVEKPKQNFWGR